MISTQYIKLNMVPSGVLPVLYCSQYDVGRPLGVVVYNHNESVDLSGYTCTIEATRTDGTAITAAVTTDGNIGAFVTTATMTNKADKYLVKLVIFDSQSNRVASLAFVMYITPKTMDENAESIEEDASLYQQYTETVQTLIAEIREDLTDLKKRTNWYVTPEEFGAVGDGVTDDTQAIQAAINSGLAVIGKGVYLVGGNVVPSGTVRNVFTITRPLTMRCRFIDNRQPTASFNLRQYAVFRIESDNVNLDIEVTGSNNLPVDSADGVNLSDIAPYAVDFTNTAEVSNCKINLTCKNVNGVGHGKSVKDSVFNIFAEHCAYPWAANYAVGCTVNIVSEDQHRAFYGAIDGSEVNVKCKNFVSTGSSDHFLLTSTVVDGVTHLCENTTINIEDTGTTFTNEGASYFSVNLNSANHKVTINAEVWIKGNAGSLDTGAFNVSNLGTVNGNLTIHNAYKNNAISRMYNSIDSFKYIEDVNIAAGSVTYQAKTTNNDQRIFVEGANIFNIAGTFNGVCYINKSKVFNITGSAVINGMIYASDIITINNNAQTQNIYISPFEKTSAYNDLKTLFQKPGDTISFRGHAVGNVYPDKTLLVAIPLPFIAKNENYSVVVNTFGVSGIVGESEAVAESVTVSSKRTTAFVLSYVGTDANMTYGRAFKAGYSVTITFA